MVRLFVSQAGDMVRLFVCQAGDMVRLFVSQAGDMVAALHRGSDGEENWILAEVISYNPSSGKYEVEDIDEEQRERMVLSRRRVIPLPTRRANPDTQPEALFHDGDVGERAGREPAV